MKKPARVCILAIAAALLGSAPCGAARTWQVIDVVSYSGSRCSFVRDGKLLARFRIPAAEKGDSSIAYVDVDFASHGPTHGDKGYRSGGHF